MKNSMLFTTKGHEGSQSEEKLPDLYVVMAIVDAARAFEKREADAAAQGMALKMRKGLTTKGHQGARRKSKGGGA